MAITPRQSLRIALRRKRQSPQPIRNRPLSFDALEDRCLMSAAPAQPHAIYINQDGPDPDVAIRDVPSNPAAVSEFQISNRWSNTASGGGLGQGDPTTITWSFADDGTDIPGLSGDQPGASNLIAFLDGIRGSGPGGGNLTQRPWFSLFADSFARLSALSGNTYVYEPNDDASAFSAFASDAPGVLGVRGDVRIGGHRIDGESGSNTLAYNFFPDNGEMVIDTANPEFYSQTTGNSVALRNVIMHEHGHGMGFNHVESSDQNFLMEPFIDTSFDGPQIDDVQALQRNYGDALEKSGGNNAFGNATNLGTINVGQTVRRGTLGSAAAVAANATDFVSIDDESDVDFYRFTINAAAAVNVTLTPRGLTYKQGPQGGAQTDFNSAAQSDLSLQLLGVNGTTVLRTANATGLGGTETIANFGLNAAGTYYLRVSGATANRVQLYGLDVALVAATGTPTVTNQTPTPGTSISTRSVNIDVTFSEQVFGVDASDLALGGAAAAGASVGTPTNTTGNTWRFPVSGLANGTLNVNLAPDANDIEDNQGNDLAPRPTSWSYTVSIGTSVFSNTAVITIPNSGPAVPNPSTINVSGLSGVITKVTASINNFSHTYPDDVDILLVGPGGQKLVLMSDAGLSTSVSGLNLVFDDAASSAVPDGTDLASGSYRPANYEPGDTFLGAPAGPLSTSLAAFNGTSPNGAWRLFVVDDASGDTGSIAGGWSLSITVSSPIPAAPIVVGRNGPGSSDIRILNSAGQVQNEFVAYPGFNGGVRVATGDFNGDGTADIYTAVGPGAGPHIKVFNGATGAELASFLAYGGFNGGVFIAAGDVNGDGRDDIITGADAGAGPHVKVFNAVNLSEIYSFYAYGAGFSGGVRVASGDVNGDGRDDIITGAGPGAGPHAKVFSGATGAEIYSFYTYDQSFTGGIYVAAGRVNADGNADIISGAGAGVSSHAKVFSGANLAELHSFLAFTGFNGGIRVAAGDLNSDGRDDIIIGAGPGAGPHVRAFDAVNLAEISSFYAYPQSFSSGIFVAGVRQGISSLRVDAPHFNVAAESLVADQLQPIKAAAIARWGDAGIVGSQLDELRNIAISLADLPGELLGIARGNSIVIDRNAAGHGWYVDATPLIDEEFSRSGLARTSAASARVDLLTTVLHEMGHVLGLDHDAEALMLGTLTPGVRRLPTTALVDAALAGW